MIKKLSLIVEKVQTVLLDRKTPLVPACHAVYYDYNFDAKSDLVIGKNPILLG